MWHFKTLSMGIFLHFSHVCLVPGNSKSDSTSQIVQDITHIIYYYVIFVESLKSVVLSLKSL